MMYNRRPIKYKTYDKIYFIVPDKHLTNDYIEKLEDLLENHLESPTGGPARSSLPSEQVWRAGRL